MHDEGDSLSLGALRVAREFHCDGEHAGKRLHGGAFYGPCRAQDEACGRVVSGPRALAVVKDAMDEKVESCGCEVVDPTEVDDASRAVPCCAGCFSLAEDVRFEGGIGFFVGGAVDLYQSGGFGEHPHVASVLEG